jgi:hypothetical protein
MKKSEINKQTFSQRKSVKLLLYLAFSNQVLLHIMKNLKKIPIQIGSFKVEDSYSQKLFCKYWIETISKSTLNVSHKSKQSIYTRTSKLLVYNYYK